MLHADALTPRPTPDHDRVLALLPVLDDRYNALRQRLRDAATGADLPDWEIDLAIADLGGVLEIMRGPTDEDEVEAP